MMEVYHTSNQCVTQLSHITNVLLRHTHLHTQDKRISP